MKKVLAIILLTATVLLGGCTAKKTSTNGETLDFILDWVPNTNHTGLYVAQALGYFEEEGIIVKIHQPPEDSSTAIVGTGKAQFCISFQDSLALALTAKHPMPVVAVAAILQHSGFGVISKEGANINRPRDLQGKRYATWGLPIEQAMVKAAVEADGGDFEKVTLIPNLVTDVTAALSTNIDAVPIFYGWDAIAAQQKGVRANFFSLSEAVPALDYYAPIIVGNENYIKAHEDMTRKFMRAVTKGYEYAAKNPDDAAKLLLNAVPELDFDITLESQRWVSGQYKAGCERFGQIDQNRWDSFFSWLYEQGLLAQEIERGRGFTNDYLPEC